jgi:hypothetical protein
VVLDAEVLGQRALDQVVDGRAAAARQVVERREHPGVDTGAELGHPGNVLAEILGNRKPTASV